MVDVLILNYNDAETTIACAKNLIGYSIVKRILIVDNCSTDDSYTEINSLKNDKIIAIKASENKGYGAGNNLGIRYLYDNFQSKYILLCNPDTVIEEESIAACEKFLKERQDYIFVAPLMKDKNGAIQSNSASSVPTKWRYVLSSEILLSKILNKNQLKRPPSHQDYYDADIVSGALFLMNTEKMLKYGTYDENVFLYSEETILSIKFKKTGQKCALLANYFFVHNHSVSVNKAFKPLKRQKILLNSRFYVMKNYLNCGFISMGIARILSFFNLIETWLLYKLFGKI